MTSRTFDFGGTVVVTAEVSGQTIITNVSGQTVISQVSGSTMYMRDMSGNAMTTSSVSTDANSQFNSYLRTQSALYGFDPSQTLWVRLRSTESGSKLSEGGTEFRLLTDTTYAGDTVQTSAQVVVTSLSGGTQLGSVRTIHGMIIKNISGNTSMFVGGIGTNAPFSGKGYWLDGGEKIELKVQSASGVRAFATTSGQLVSWIGVDF